MAEAVFSCEYKSNLVAAKEMRNLPQYQLMEGSNGLASSRGWERGILGRGVSPALPETSSPFSYCTVFSSCST